jgi:hypothetical protein
MAILEILLRIFDEAFGLSLNYLVYMQNINMNSTVHGNETPNFPYIDSLKWGVLEELGVSNQR